METVSFVQDVFDSVAPDSSLELFGLQEHGQFFAPDASVAPARPESAPEFFHIQLGQIARNPYEKLYKHFMAKRNLSKVFIFHYLPHRKTH